MATIEEFIREYTRAVYEGYAAVFAGAGLSRSSGHVDWKELVRPLANDIGLNVDKERDLIAIAQYYRNERGSRHGINSKILNEFNKQVEINENIKITTRLPISTYWTTNYDDLLEQGLELNNRKADIKLTQESLASNIYDRDAVVYKMHGDAKLPAEAVLTKDDYEIYGNERPLFRTVLQGDLVSKTFIFIGFSFEDPNLNYVLGQIRLLLQKSIRDHYCFFEGVKQEAEENIEDYIYRKAKQDLRIKDLCRYGIQAIVLDSYDDITDILSRVESGYLLKNVFISGSASQFSEAWDKKTGESLAFSLSKNLVHNDYRIISGFGLGIGSSVVNGALEEIMLSKFKHVDEHLCLRPFPQTVNGVIPKKDLWRKYREDMINQAGIAIFMFGNNVVDQQTVIAEGVLEEYRVAKERNIAVIPIGSTGWAAREIFDEITQNITEHPYLQGHIEILGTSNDQKQLIESILKIVKSLQVF